MPVGPVVLMACAVMRSEYREAATHALAAAAGWRCRRQEGGAGCRAGERGCSLGGDAGTRRHGSHVRGWSREGLRERAVRLAHAARARRAEESRRKARGDT